MPKLPTLSVGTDNWGGGLVQISERGGEIVDLPQGSRVYPHDESVTKAYEDGKASTNNKNTITIEKLADSIVIREEADIDKITNALVRKLSNTVVGGIA